MSLTAPDFTYVADLVHRESAITLAPGKEYLVEARLLPVARDTGHGTVPALVAELKGRPMGELHRKVIDAMTTNETSWFRDRAPFTALAEDLLGELIARRSRERKLRIWSAACSSGQEPYSIIMAITDRLAAAGFGLEVLATDLSEEMLERARAGRYNQLEVNRGLAANLLVRHFTRAGTGWQVSEELRRAVTFRSMNLAVPFPPMMQMDVIFLRNVLIYFDAPTKARVLNSMSRVLRPDGYLFLGGAETTINIDPRFERITSSGATVYRFRGEATG
jgi:chemotaxis protein methyltransferase CheR